MVNYVCAFSQSELGKYFEWIIIEVNFFISRGYDFRPDYGKLETIASVFPSKPFIAVTATAPVPYQDAVL